MRVYIVVGDWEGYGTWEGEGVPEAEIIWVKTNQLQRIIRIVHWLDYGKENCLVGAKGNLLLNMNVDEVRPVSHKSDEIYGTIERLVT